MSTPQSLAYPVSAGYYYTPTQPRRSGSGGLILFLIGTAVVLGATGYYIYQRNQPSTATAPTPSTTTPSTQDDTGATTGDSTMPSKDDTTVSYGDLLFIQNQYAPSTYLDVCGASLCKGKYNVQTHTSTTREGPSGTWMIEGGEAGTPVKYGDPVSIQSQYEPKPYLDICGLSSCEGGKYNVHTHPSKTREGKSGTWVIVGGKQGDPVKYDELVNIQSQFAPNPYLEVCGDFACDGGKYAVHTHMSPTRDGESGTWKLVKSATTNTMAQMGPRPAYAIPPYQYKK